MVFWLIPLLIGAALVGTGAYVATVGPDVVIEEAEVNEAMSMGWKSWLVLGIIAIIIIWLVFKKFFSGG